MSFIVCLLCDCPANIKTGMENWTCPFCGNGLVKVVSQPYL